MTELIVRASTEADMARCAEIYAHHVLQGLASFEETPPGVDELRRRFEAVRELGLPYLACVEREALQRGVLGRHHRQVALVDLGDDALGEGGIGIVRLSGPEAVAVELASSVAVNPRAPAPRSAANHPSSSPR
mgnify:CR=1 FL=1